MGNIALKAAHFASATLNNPWGVGSLSFILIIVPVIGMWAVHKYNWQHWAPFDRGH
tara:strand:- start:85 stop:252 length:168 start_codon:yes stop_codon:yes gene_type:complete